jgi:hypothetical protein
MLDTTRAGTFVAGSNRAAAASGAAWLALLPTQEPGAALVLGIPSRPVLMALAGAARALTVRCRTSRDARRARRILAGTAAQIDVGPIPEGAFDLIGGAAAREARGTRRGGVRRGAARSRPGEPDAAHAAAVVR